MFVSKPTQLRASNVTYTSVRVDWNPAPEPFILGYRILVQNIPLNEILSWRKTYAHVSGLSSNTQYIISVSPVHGLTDEEYPVTNAGSIIVTTKEMEGKQFFMGLPAMLVLCSNSYVKYGQLPEPSFCR